MSRALSALLQRVPARMRGKHRICRWLIPRLIETSSPRRVPGREGLEYFLPNIDVDEQVAFEIYISGIVEPETIDFMSRHVQSDALLFDIGANIGGISLPLAKRRSDLSIVCVEAAPQPFRFLERNIALNSLTQRIRAFELALSDRDVSQVEFYSPAAQFGKGSLSPVFTDSAMIVPNLSLDELVARVGRAPAFIKIDVEGYEYSVFNSGRDYLRRERPEIVFEFCDWAEAHAGNRPGDSQRLLLDLGYRIARITQPEVALRAPLEQGFDMLWASPRG